MLVALAAADGGLPASQGGIETTADPLRNEEAWSWFRERVPITREQWNALDQQSRRRAFTVSGVTALDVLDHVWREIDRAIADGTSFEDFRKRVTESLESQWGGSNPSRVETIFRTNVQSAYAAGRYQQMRDPDVIASRPYWEFVAILDSATSEICRPLEGVVRSADDPFWGSHYPPLHFNCRSSVMTLTARQANQRGVVAPPESDPPLEGFGSAPSLTEWQPRAEDYPEPLWNAYRGWSEHR